MKTTFAKLSDGTWGVRGSAAIVTANAGWVNVVKKDGSIIQALVSRIVWTDGKTALASIHSTSSPAQRSKGTGSVQGVGADAQ